MNQTIYLVKKDPAATGSKVEWLQLTGREFYSFIHSPEGKNRYFIRLTDDISYECPEIFIEAGYEDYRKWKSEYNAHQYLVEQEEGFETISANAPATGDSSLIDTIADEGASTEDAVVKADELRNLAASFHQLSMKEKKIVRVLFLSRHPMTVREAAAVFGVSKSELARQKKKILKKIAKKLGTNPK